MIALQITDIRLFMHKFLYETVFDSFSLEEGMLSTEITYYLEGRVHPEFYSEKDLDQNPSLARQEFIPWNRIRLNCCQLIKGSNTPLQFKFVLHADDTYIQTLLNSENFTADPSCLKNLLLTIRFEHGRLNCLTGIAYHSFVLDKSADLLWDQAVRHFISEMGIHFEEL